MRVVLDTNVLVSGLLSPYGPPGELVRLVAVGALQVCYDARILTEYREVLLRPLFSFSLVQVETLLEQIKAGGLTVGARPLSAPLPDPDDEVFLAVALAGPAPHLVTGNTKHFPVKSRQGVQVVSPAEFLSLYRKQMTQDQGEGGSLPTPSEG
ncbi:MAG: putative toxin-antitoxin system toxin component, PIN family [Candidatus Latescibacteria bacterium]|nr:putative toxin-antitoxin system toxin component, PIN family [Candidatus Latescibacterota bacterium]